MKKLFKKSLAVLLTLAMLAYCVPLIASAETYSGTCGDNLSWTLDTSSGVLEISGEGEMDNYSVSGAPWRNSIKSVNIKNGVTTIGDYAFSECFNLICITIPDSVTRVGKSAFYGCLNLETIEIPASITNIGVATFSYCEGLKRITVSSDNVAYSSDEHGVLFNKDKTELIKFPEGKMESDYVIPDSVTNVADISFLNCKNLINVELSNSITSIGEYAFLSCENLKNIAIGGGLTQIGEYAFACCYSLESIELPNRLSIIDKNVFYMCCDLTSVRIPDGTTSIGEGAFVGCTELTYVIVPDSVVFIGMGAFYSCTALEYVHIPYTVTEIEERILYNTTAYICSPAEDCYAKTYAEENGIEFRLCTDHAEEPTTEHKHTPKTVSVPASCTVNGMEYTICAECGEPIGDVTIIPAGHTYGEWETVTEATCKTEGKRIKKCTVCGEILQTETIDKKAHTPGEWETVIEPTVDADGKRVKKCVVCGEVLEEEAIAKLKVSTAVDEKTGVEMDYVSYAYEGEVEINVEESFDGTAFDIIDTTLNSTQKFIYDITMTVNGVATQPNGKVTVKIPLPSGYDPTRTFVYHINSNTGKLEPMYAEYLDGYLVFETTHFSYYALVEVLDVELKINKTSKTKINFGDTLVLQLEEIEIPEGYAATWLVEGAGVSTSVSEDGLECRVTSIANGSATIYAKLVDEEENVVTNADGEEFFDEITLTSKAGFWQRFISFFKNLFGINRVIY